MANKSMQLPNNDLQNYPFCRLQLKVERLDTHLIKPTNKNSIKVLKVFKLSNQKMFYKTLGTNVIDSPISSPSLTLYISLSWNVCCFV